MSHWAVKILLLAAAGWAIWRFLGFLAAGRHPLATDALLAGGQFVDIDGIRVHYENSGAGPPAVLIHGLLGSVDSWDALTPLLADIATTYALDLPGSGLSDKPRDRKYEPAEHAAILIKFVETVIGRSVRLVTTSAGAQVALAAMVRRPDLFSGLAALAPALEFTARSLTARDAHRLATVITHALRSRRLVRLPLNFATGPDARITDEQLSALMIPAHTAGYRDALAISLVSRTSGRREQFSPSSDLPVLIICGLDDRLAPTADAEWLRLQSGGDLHILPGCGHLPESERPQDVAVLLRDFLSDDGSGESA
jgi:pimeloyl-ACP methyl ester carboxylesterase